MAKSNDYFVMLATQNGSFTPMMDDDEIAKFPSVYKARNAAKQTVLGEAFGFQIFRYGSGQR
ncbi:hypothetical protein ACP3V3_02930 [Vibrio sp. PNB22_3_1]